MTVVVSTAPAAIDALVALGRVSWPQEGDGAVRVFDGGPVRDSEITHDALFVGFSPEDDFVVTDTRTREQMASSPDTERYDITCLATSWDGQKISQKTVRDRAYGLIDQLAGHLASDQTLGGVVMRARVSSTSLGQAQTNMGATATVRFAISVLAATR